MFFWNSKKSNPDQKVVMAFGTFDLLHAGHEHFLNNASKYGDHLIVVIARDNTVRTVKGQEPINNENLRVKNLKKTGWANQVVLGNHEDKHKIIIRNKPTVIALGYDQFVFTQTLKKTIIENQLKTEIVRMEAFDPHLYKSSILRKNL